jgi:hypothetical protein
MPLTNYGTPTHAYSGTGQLLRPSIAPIQCTFECGQLPDGNIIATAYSTQNDAGNDGEVNRLTGHTVDGEAVDAEIIISMNVLGVGLQMPEGTYLTHRANRLTVNAPNPHPVTARRYGIVNFRFFGNEVTTVFDAAGHLQSHRRHLRLDLAHPSGRVAVQIEPVANYSQVALKVSTLGETAVTCEAVIDPATVPAGVDPDHLISDLCLLMSVARGTWVQWIYRRDTDANGAQASITHANHITRKYQGPPPLDPRAGRHEHTRRFLEGAFAALPNVVGTFDVRRGLIQAYVDGRSEEDYLEMRGAKIAVVAEMIKAQHLGMAPLPSGQKYPPFRKALRAACRAAGYRPSSRDLNEFIQSRNRLVHAGRFRADPLKPLPGPFATPEAEYFFMVSFLDRFFLRLFDYTGPFLEWAKYPQHEEGLLT